VTLAQLRALYRALARDEAEPYLASNATLDAFLNEAEDEAAKRARLIHDDSTPEVCEIDVEETSLDSGIYPHTFTLHASLYELSSVRLFIPANTTEPVTLKLVSREWLDANMPDWRTSTVEPSYAIQDDTTLRIVPGPTAEGQLKLEGYRLPLEVMTETTDTPEINAAHHRHLVQWAIYRVFGLPDTELFDANKSAKALAEFEGYFGIRVDSDLRRSTRHDTEHHNTAILV
jgi:hypothetical protein